MTGEPLAQQKDASMRQPAETYRVAILTHQRPKALAERTLTFLSSTSVDPDRITIFVNSTDPYIDAYGDVAKAFNVALHPMPVEGIGEARKYVTEHYPEGTPVVQLDDDITELSVVTPDGKKTRPQKNLDRFFTRMFKETADRGLYVWGVAPVPNHFFLKPKQLSESLKFVIYTFCGYYARPGHPVHDTHLRTKEDYDFSLRAWWYDGAVLRHDGAAPKADHYKLPGGAVSYRSYEIETESANTLLATWPGLIRLNTKRKSGYPEVSLNPRKRHAGNSVDTPPPGLS